MIRKAMETGRQFTEARRRLRPAEKRGERRSGGRERKGSDFWIPFASFCTTGQFTGLGSGFQRHCGPTAAVNVIRTLTGYRASVKDLHTEKKTTGRNRGQAGPAGREPAPADLFLLCAQEGRKTLAYWNTDVLGRFGGTSNFLTGVFLRRCLQAAGADRGVSVRFHPWITPDAVARALDRGEIVYLEVYRHPRYKNHHMLCYACRTEDGARSFLLADGWTPAPVWTDAKGLGHGHFLTVSCSAAGRINAPHVSGSTAVGDP